MLQLWNKEERSWNIKCSITTNECEGGVQFKIYRYNFWKSISYRWNLLWDWHRWFWWYVLWISNPAHKWGNISASSTQTIIETSSGHLRMRNVVVWCHWPFQRVKSDDVIYELPLYLQQVSQKKKRTNCEQTFTDQSECSVPAFWTLVEAVFKSFAISLAVSHPPFVVQVIDYEVTQAER